MVGNPEDPVRIMEDYDGAAWEWFAEPGFVIRTVTHGRASSAAELTALD